MSLLLFVLMVLVLAAISFRMGRGRALALVGGQARRLSSLPNYHGAYVLLWCAVPFLALVVLWVFLEPVILEALVISSLPDDVGTLPADRLASLYAEIRGVAANYAGTGETDEMILAAAGRYNGLTEIATAGSVVLFTLAAAFGGMFGLRHLGPSFPARAAVERCIKFVLIVSSTIAILTTIGIVLSLLFEAIRFFDKVPILEFLLGTEWSPQTALRADQVGSSGKFGAVPIFTGTLLISLIAMAVASPIGLFSAIYLAEYANRRVRDVVKPILEILAGIPTVVYGFFAALTIAPVVRDTGGTLGLDVASESALAAGLVMGVMIIPFISSLSDDAITAVPGSLRDGSLALGATRSETIRRVILPAALPGLVGGLLLAASRAIGETMIVVMAAGLAANLTANPFQAVTTVTVQIVTLLVGDQEFNSPKTLAAFALGLVLFVVTLCLNLVALAAVRKYREQYD